MKLAVLNLDTRVDASDLFIQRGSGSVMATPTRPREHSGRRQIRPARGRKGLQPCIANEREPLAMVSLDNVPDDAEPGVLEALLNARPLARRSCQGLCGRPR